MHVRTVVVTYHNEAGSWWSESEDVAGFSVAASSLRELRALTRQGIVFALDLESEEQLDLREQSSSGAPAVDSLTSLPGWPSTTIGYAVPRESTTGFTPARVEATIQPIPA